MKRLVIMMGSAGAGKDTQAQLLAQRFGYHIINTGDAVRARTQADPQLAEQLARGELVSNELINDLVASIIDQLPATSRLISDGYPRRLPQAEWFDGFLAETGRAIDLVIFLEIPHEVSQQRLAKRHRADDKRDSIERRLALFETDTLPVLEYYRQRGLLQRVNGDRPVDAIHRQLVDLVQ